MCAIAGVLALPIREETVGAMLATMNRRGPDGNGVHWLEDGCLLHSRLSVIDPTGGQQPMDCTWEGHTYTIVYNGELYNTQQLRRELEACGHVFCDRSDTRVLLHAYAQWGAACLEKLNGIYAFCVWEHDRCRAFLARDRIGVKPLFYCRKDGGLLFASEMKTIFRYPGIRAALNGEGAAQLLLLGPGRVPGSGVFKDMEELEPGCYGVFENGRWHTKRYWHLEDREHTENFEETAEQVRALVTDAIRGQMVSDVPIGAFLSGGLDSSLICSVCAEELGKRGEKLTTFSVDYENNALFFVPGKFQPNADNHYISIMRQYLQTNHQETVLQPEQLMQALEAATVARDLPGMADVDFSLLAFCGDVRKHVTVALSGECADEIFGGYPWYTDPEVRALDGFPWAQNTKYRSGFLHPYFADQMDGAAYVADHYRTTIAQSDILPGTSEQERRMKEMVNLNFRWFMQTLLDRKDRMSMYHGLEVRVPFCDHRIAQYLYGVPWEYKHYDGKEKGLLRYAMGSYLPKEVLWRKKSPYPKTYDPRYLQMVSDALQRLLEEPNAPLWNLVKREAAQGLLQAEYAWPWYGQLMKLPQTIAYFLQINCWLQTYDVQIL